MENDKYSLSMLLVGASGEGKSEFILSFINSEHRNKILASGDGQTTRTSMVYSISSDKVPLKIEISLKSKTAFCEDRISRFMKNFILDKIQNKKVLEIFKDFMLHDSAFFDCNEFECGKDIEQKFDEIFDTGFFSPNSFKKPSECGENSDGKYVCENGEAWITNNFKNIQSSKKQYTLEDCLSAYAEWVFDACMNELTEHLKSFGIDLQKGSDEKTDISKLSDIPDSQNEIQKYIKTDHNCVSYSSLIERVYFHTFVADYYLNMFEHLRLKECRFIDTYGLDHKEVASNETVKLRYGRLFKEFPEISTVIYIRKAQSSSPTDLNQNIPLLYAVKPSIMSYIVFTHADKAGKDGKKTIDAIKKEDSDVYKDVYIELINSDVNPDLSDMRIKCMLENIVEYCSWVGSNRLDEKTELQFIERNCSQLTKLLLAIRDKKHLGSQYLNMNSMSLEDIGDLLDVNKIFEGHKDFDGYPGRTMGALADRLQSGLLGFESRTWGYFKCWDDEIFNYVKRRFWDISNEYEWARKLNSENIVPVIQSLFNEFMDLSIKCKRNPEQNFTNYPTGEFCTSCNKKDKCIQNIFYDLRKTQISKKYYPVAQWLTKIYDFSSFDDETRSRLQDIFNMLYIDSFIPLCRSYNARVLASELDGKMSEQEIDEKIQNYFENYDSQLDDDNKIQFEQEVNQFLN